MKSKYEMASMENQNKEKVAKEGQRI